MSDTTRGPQGRSHTIVATSEGMKVSLQKRSRYNSVNLLDESDDLVREQLGGFIRFLRDHAVVGVAIGFIVGLQAQTLIKQLVESFITPLLTLLVGPNLQNKRLLVHGTNPVSFAWGEFLYTLTEFLVVLLFIYLVVKLFRLDKLDKR